MQIEIGLKLSAVFRSEVSHRTTFDKKRFFFYMLYAWGISSLLTFIIFILDYTKPLPDRFLPGLGTWTCFLKGTNLNIFHLFVVVPIVLNNIDLHYISDELSTRVYFYAPNSIIYSINIVLFVLTVRKIRKIQLDIISVMSQDRHSHYYQNCVINKNNKYID